MTRGKSHGSVKKTISNCIVAMKRRVSTQPLLQRVPEAEKGRKKRALNMVLELNIRAV